MNDPTDELSVCLMWLLIAIAAGWAVIGGYSLYRHCLAASLSERTAACTLFIHLSE